MSKDLKTKPRTKKPRARYKAVNVWRSTFGPTAVKAVYDIYSQKFNVESHNMKNYSFSHCVEALRKLEDPNYVSADRSSAY